ncbi:GNAT family N-acetyltransferase, partial [Plantactinospora solaniradicis]
RTYVRWPGSLTGDPASGVFGLTGSRWATEPCAVLKVVRAMVMLVISPVDLDDLMHQGWPALASLAIDGWLVRLSQGVTQRANSVLPVSSPQDLVGALERVELLYRGEGLRPIFQISPAAQPAELDAILAARGYELRSPTLVQVARIDDVLHQLPTSDVSVAVDNAPDEEWLDLWWSIDGRGDADARAVARRLLVAGPALYASIRDGAGAAAVGRLALVDGWGGIYCMAVREDARRRGYAKAVLRALLERASKRGIQGIWLQVVADNHAARALYERSGFTRASSYHYRTQRSPGPAFTAG